MNRNELFQNLESWLQQHGFVYEADSAANAVTFDFTGSAGDWACEIICEEEPSMLQIICRLPVRVPGSHRQSSGRPRWEKRKGSASAGLFSSGVGKSPGGLEPPFRTLQTRADFK